ncbi:MAG: glycosyltransferase involved in cell wall biosynthesis [Saprospiraceae bacterium]|jgi:glycosyltransferase involved in cell wall biosynthesis
MKNIEFKTSLKDIYIVIPAKNEDNYLNDLITQILTLGLYQVVVVNDQSTDKTRDIAEQFQEAYVLDHVINLGAGAATQTGIAFAASKNAQIIVTIDADLQHNPEDIPRLIKHMEEINADLVIGSRFISSNSIPTSRRIYNGIANIVSFLLTGKYLTDSQSGLKAISGSLAQDLNLNYDGFEFCMEIIKHAKITHSKISEIPVDVRYTAETTAKGQNLRSGIEMISRLLSPFS